VKEQPETFRRFGAPWTPTQLVLDESGKERYRIEGFLPLDDFLAQLKMALGRLAFEDERFPEAEQRFLEVCREHPTASGAAEACYWAGVSEYKERHEPSPLAQTARLLQDRYPGSEWTKKASVWAG
jgi:TolA-binding protein